MGQGGGGISPQPGRRTEFGACVQWRFGAHSWLHPEEYVVHIKGFTIGLGAPVSGTFSHV